MLGRSDPAAGVAGDPGALVLPLYRRCVAVCVSYPPLYRRVCFWGRECWRECGRGLPGEGLVGDAEGLVMVPPARPQRPGLWVGPSRTHAALDSSLSRSHCSRPLPPPPSSTPFRPLPRSPPPPPPPPPPPHTVLAALDATAALLEQYCHPSNSGRWSGTLVNLMKELGAHLAKRLVAEHVAAGGAASDSGMGVRGGHACMGGDTCRLRLDVLRGERGGQQIPGRRRPDLSCRRPWCRGRG